MAALLTDALASDDPMIVSLVLRDLATRHDLRPLASDDPRLGQLLDALRDLDLELRVHPRPMHRDATPTA